MRESEPIELRKNLAELKDGLIIPKIVSKTIDNVSRPTKEIPKKRRRNTKEIILEVLRDRPEMTMRELAPQLDLTIDSIRHHIRMFQDAGVIRHLGSTKAGRWEIVK